jgi:hypothetical protein
VDREFVQNFRSSKDFVIFRIAFQERRCMAETATLEKLVELAKQLSVVDKIRFIERLAPPDRAGIEALQSCGAKTASGSVERIGTLGRRYCPDTAGSLVRVSP